MQQPDYDAIPAMNWSTLKRLHTSPLLYQWRIDHPEPDKEAFRLGRALHCSILEPERFYVGYVGQPDFGDGRTKEAKAAKADWLESVPPGAEILSAKEYTNLRLAGESVRRHRVASQMLRGGRAEEIVQWIDPATGLACKARLDYVRPDYLIDLKKARDVTQQRLGSALAGHLVHGQTAWYQDGARAAGVLPPDAIAPRVIAVQMEEPYDVTCLRMTEATLAAGRTLYRELMTRYTECQAAGVWPGCSPDLVDWELPNWAPGMVPQDTGDFA